MAELFKKLILYKRVFYAVVVFNGFLMVMGGVLCVSFFTSKKQQLSDLNQAQTHLEQLYVIESEIQKLESQKKPQTEDFFVLTQHLNTSPIAELQKRWGFSNTQKVVSQKSLAALQSHVAELIKGFYVQINQSANNFANWTYEVIAIGLLTFIFVGVVPWYLLFLLGKLTLKTQKEARTHIDHWVESWTKTLEKHDDEAFKSGMFWLKITLLTIESAAPKGRHPAFTLANELAPLIRKELEKVDSSSTEQDVDRPKTA